MIRSLRSRLSIRHLWGVGAAAGLAFVIGASVQAATTIGGNLLVQTGIANELWADNVTVQAGGTPRTVFGNLSIGPVENGMPCTIRSECRSGTCTNGVCTPLWFMHISDSHVGKGCSAREKSALVWAISVANRAITPSFIVNTGDLVEGQDNFWCSLPLISTTPWDEYNDAVGRGGMDPSFYFDVIGNHDLYFPEPAIDGYRTYSIQGSAHASTPVADTGRFSWTRANYLFQATNTVGTKTWCCDSGCFNVDPVFGGPSICGGGVSPIWPLITDLTANIDKDLKFVFGHMPLGTYNYCPSLGSQCEFDTNQTTPNTFRDTLAKAGALYLQGHWHRPEQNVFASPYGRVVTSMVGTLGKGNSGNVAVGAIDGTSFAYRWTDYDSEHYDDSMTFPLVVITSPSSTKLARNPDQLLWEQAAPNPYKIPVCKNKVTRFSALAFFDPLRADQQQYASYRVELQIPGLAFKSMTQSAHPRLWTADADLSSLSPGEYRVQVAATWWYSGPSSDGFPPSESKTDVIFIDLQDCTTCTPTTCAAQSKNCGRIRDGCGGTLDCGSCPSGQNCSWANQCCQPKTCASMGYVCGTYFDDCAGAYFYCGTCPVAGQICNGTYCGCPTGQKQCNGKCISTDSACCPSGQKDCGGQCWPAGNPCP
jgi:hypothetical protein